MLLEAERVLKGILTRFTETLTEECGPSIENWVGESEPTLRNTAEVGEMISTLRMDVLDVTELDTHEVRRALDTLEEASERAHTEARQLLKEDIAQALHSAIKRIADAPHIHFLDIVDEALSEW